MQLLGQLLLENFTVQITLKRTPNTGKPVPLSPDRPGDLILTAPSGQVVSASFSAHYLGQIDQVLARLLQKNFPDSKALAAWRIENGQAAVRLVPHAMESLAEAMHSGLRKLADTGVSCITYGAIHHMYLEDLRRLWDAAAAVLNDKFKAEATPTRFEVAEAVRDTVRATIEKLTYEERDLKAKRSHEQAFALQMLSVGAKMTDIEEWMWGWLGFVLENARVKKLPVAPVKAKKKASSRRGATVAKRRRRAA